MGNHFCTSCGHSAALDAKFCDNCGAVFQNAGSPESAMLPGISATGTTPITQPTPAGNHTSTWGKWLDVGSKSAGLGAPFVAIFDFLSPRVALLPIAATLAIAGLLVTLALRKFVAPSLPATSKFRMVVAPEAGLHQSRLMIGTTVLSALMVTGAAWSHANAPAGGVIASKFDAAKNTQMQLGILQVMQKEQRGQTAVLEDIRDGRTLNPRRELANQGILWTYKAFDDALEAKDLAVVTLFIAGGMTWGPHAGLKALWSKQDAISDRLISRPELLDPDAVRQSQYGCFNYIQVFNQPTKETENLKDPKQIQPRVLRTQDKQWLKLICGSEKGQTTALVVLQDQMAKYSSLPAAECRKRLANNDASALEYVNLLGTSIPFARDESETATLRQVLSEQSAKASSDILKPMTPANNRDFSTPKPEADPKANRVNEASTKILTPQVVVAITEYCNMVSRRPPAEYNGWTVESMKQIVAALN
jgi:hypothetical protein